MGRRPGWPAHKPPRRGETRKVARRDRANRPTGCPTTFIVSDRVSRRNTAANQPPPHARTPTTSQRQRILARTPLGQTPNPTQTQSTTTTFGVLRRDLRAADHLDARACRFPSQAPSVRQGVSSHRNPHYDLKRISSRRRNSSPSATAIVRGALRSPQYVNRGKILAPHTLSPQSSAHTSTGPRRAATNNNQGETEQRLNHGARSMANLCGAGSMFSLCDADPVVSLCGAGFQPAGRRASAEEISRRDASATRDHRPTKRNHTPPNRRHFSIPLFSLPRSCGGRQAPSNASPLHPHAPCVYSRQRMQKWRCATNTDDERRPTRFLCSLSDRNGLVWIKEGAASTVVKADSLRPGRRPYGWGPPNDIARGQGDF